jgi:hypothetical protein
MSQRKYRRGTKGTFKKKPMSRKYLAYVKSAVWKARRQAFRSKGLAKHCWCCAKDDVPLQIHHLTYENIGNERDDELVAVCGPCHWLIHRIATGVGIRKATDKVRSIRKPRVFTSPSQGRVLWTATEIIPLD